MPTGYTSDIKNGISFKEFIFQCSRAFGAFIDVKDKPLSPNIPDEVIPDTYHRDSLSTAEKELDLFKKLNKKQLLSKYSKFLKDSKRSYNSSKKSAEALKNKYVKMLKHVCKWVPPTEEHEGLKSFMIQQITDSIKNDCFIGNKPRKISFKGWYKEQIKHLNWNINYHRKHWELDVKNANERTEWIKKLKESVK